MNKILVVDDDMFVRVVLKHTLVGYEVVLAEDGRQALALVEWEKPDLIIMDVLMPALDGITTAQLVAKRHDIPVIFISEAADEIKLPPGLNARALVGKPFDPIELRKIVSDSLSEESHENKLVMMDAQVKFCR